MSANNASILFCFLSVSMTEIVGEAVAAVSFVLSYAQKKGSG